VSTPVTRETGDVGKHLAYDRAKTGLPGKEMECCNIWY
jgi:hypothetical protein